jgi:MYXO-CTERM domain-containing protein
MIRRGPTSLVVVVAGFSISCASAPEDVGRSNAQVDYVCNQNAAATLDGIPAYAYCGNFNVWSNNGVDTKSTSGGSGWVQTEGGYGYQCVEYANRYMHFRFGTSTSWGISYAKQMCATHPAGVSTTTTPVHGDLIVFAGGSCGADATAGHVAVVDKVNATTVSVVQENTAGTQTFNKTCASCFLHAASNTGDPCSAAPKDGLYCGQSPRLGPGGTKDTLYSCVAGATKTKTACANGCVVQAPGTDDTCTPAPGDAGSDGSSSSDAAPPGDGGGTQDASPPAPDASPLPQGDAGAGDVGTDGGCSTGGAGTSRNGFVAFLFGALLLARRRRRA